MTQPLLTAAVEKPLNVDHEARRVAFAFEVASYFAEKEQHGVVYFRSSIIHHLRVSWSIPRYADNFSRIQVTNHPDRTPSGYSQIYQAMSGQWNLTYRRAFGIELVRGLYRLGFTDESVLSQLPELTMHEQMEARLSLPREFWPQAWMEEVRE